MKQSRQHSLSDWLDLHELDPESCRLVLDTMTNETAGGPTAPARPGPGAPDLDVAWLRTAEAMRDFFPEHRGVIDDTFEKTARIVVDPRGDSRKAATIDNGPGTYPTILYSYRREPADFLVLAHEFAHALQIRASRGKFVPPIMRETCAFLGEGALLSYIQRCDAAHYPDLIEAWRQANAKYFGTQKERLHAALLRPEAPYNYGWNYPVARYLALRISKMGSRDRVWRLFEGESSVRDVLRELGFFPNE